MYCLSTLPTRLSTLTMLSDYDTVDVARGQRRGWTVSYTCRIPGDATNGQRGRSFRNRAFYPVSRSEDSNRLARSHSVAFSQLRCRRQVARYIDDELRKLASKRAIAVEMICCECVVLRLKFPGYWGAAVPPSVDICPSCCTANCPSILHGSPPAVTQGDPCAGS